MLVAKATLIDLNLLIGCNGNTVGTRNSYGHFKVRNPKVSITGDVNS